MADESLFAPSLQMLLDYERLQWIFVGGKGGVGKTTTSCALACLLAQTPVKVGDATRKRKVLIISTDPAHNLSDAFKQPFTAYPTTVEGYDNLYAVEMDPTSYLKKQQEASGPKTSMGAIFSILRKAAVALPGIDEVTVFLQIMRAAKKLSYDTVVFDTAPTGHTLRLLSLPSNLQKSLKDLFAVEGFHSIVNTASAFFGLAGQKGADAAPKKAVTVEEKTLFDIGEEDDDDGSEQSITQTLEKWQRQIEEVHAQFTDHSKTAFVCVCIPEFLSLYETERLIQELVKYNINCCHIVVNQLIKKKSTDCDSCTMCNARLKIQKKYMKSLHALYAEDFHIVQMPLLGDEVRGPKALSKFAQYLVTPFDPDVHSTSLEDTD